MRLLLVLLALLAVPAPSSAEVSIGISVELAPPPLPIYEQPPIPGYGYIWMPGYWAYGPDGYYWVPGTWVLPPAVGLFWTPPWWGWSNGIYVFHDGYWGPHVGFYGGINYGFGYFGEGYEGGYWRSGRFYYNRRFNNFGRRHINYVYSRPMRHHGPENHVSFNGGTGGIAAQPSAQDRAAGRDRHWRPTTLQTQHFNAARSNRSLHFSTNNGQPPITATPRPGRFDSSGTVTHTPRVQPTTPQQRTLQSTPVAPRKYRSTTPGGIPRTPQSAPKAPSTYRSTTPGGTPRKLQSAPAGPKTYRSTTPSGTPRTLQSAPKAPPAYRSTTPSGAPRTLQSAPTAPKTYRSITPRGTPHVTTQGGRGQLKRGGKPKDAKQQ